MDETGQGLVKRPTRIPGLDAVTRGGLPAAGASLVMGEPGCGKTVLGLQILAGAVARGEGAVLVSFEESREEIERDARSFTWGADLTGAGERLQVIDARGVRDAEVAGGFDLDGLLAAIAHCVERIGASWVVLDGIDQLLRLQPDPGLAADQVARINDWCRERGLSVVLTGKQANPDAAGADYLAGIEFMLATVIVLANRLIDQRLHRRFRISKYRGTGHITDELALLIDDDGVHIPCGTGPAAGGAAATRERVGTGVPRLDDVLQGGLYRGSTTLISGQPGTAKTTLAAAFAAAAAGRGERVLFLSFDERSDRIVRNVASVGIDLQTPLDAGYLRLEARAAWQGTVERHFLDLLRLLEEVRPDCLVVDPASALLKTSSEESAFVAIERILDHAAGAGITTLLTSLSEKSDPEHEATLSHTSTLVDTWIVLYYQMRSGERNRALSVVKSRGTGHSNQVRELVLGAGGVDLEDAYRFGTEVLMGTARLQKESEEEAARRHREAERGRQSRALQEQITHARARVTLAESELEGLLGEAGRQSETHSAEDSEVRAHERRVRARREPGRDGAWSEQEDDR